MIEFFVDNLGTIIVALVLTLTLAFVTVKLIKDRKAGRSSCGCGCSSCPYSGKCHAADESGNS